MSLRDKYNHAIQTAKGFKMEGAAEERDGKLYFKGTVQSQDQSNKIWDAIKTVPTWQTEVVADIKAVGPARRQPLHQHSSRSRNLHRQVRRHAE